ncbi:MAG TPA: hypothetical protein VGP72_02250 [Planctomycetota bacterium]|jgi:hypothetical protein
MRKAGAAGILILLLAFGAAPVVFYLATGAAAPDPGPIAFRASPRHEQWAAVLSGFVVKPTYMILSLALAWVLRKQRAPDLVALQWSMLFFFAGEFACALDYCSVLTNLWIEYAHSYGMVLALAAGTLAFFDAVDRRILSLSDSERKCAALNICKRCAKHADVPCGLRRVFQIVVPALIVMAALPLCAVPCRVSYNTSIFNVAAYNYVHPLPLQWYELRFCPVAASAMFLVAFVLLLGQRGGNLERAKFFTAGGLGFLLFGYLRLILFAAFRDNLVWFGFWEEITELLGVLAVAAVLWIFRHGLFAKDQTP